MVSRWRTKGWRTPSREWGSGGHRFPPCSGRSRCCEQPLLASLGWLSWALGRGSVAGEYVRRAREADPEYGFAELLDTMLGNGMLPEWAFDRAVPGHPPAERRLAQ